MSTASIMPLPIKPDFRAIAGNGTVKATSKPKDPTAALRQRRRRVRIAEAAAVAIPAPTAPTVTAEKPNDVTVSHGASHGVDRLAYVAAVALAGAAAWFSIRGMVVLFPGSPQSVVAMAVSMEVAKLVTAGWLSRSWRGTAWIWRLILVVLVAGLAVINAAGVYAQLVAAHVGERGAAQVAVQTQGADIDARIEVAAGRLADLDRRLGQIDSAIEEATKRGRTSAALNAIESQRHARTALAGERERAAGASGRSQDGTCWRGLSGAAAGDGSCAHCLRRRNARRRRGLGAGYPVADRAHGAVLRSAGHRPHSRGIGAAMILAAAPPEEARR